MTPLHHRLFLTATILTHATAISLAIYVVSK